MKINTLKVTEYRGSRIYVRNFGSTFEWIAVYKGELYTSHNTIYRSWWQILTGQSYTSKQLTDIAKMSIATAEATIDYLLDELPKQKKASIARANQGKVAKVPTTGKEM